MGMPFELNTMIVTKGLETRIEQNLFTLIKDGYRLYPLDIPLEVRKLKDSDTNGTAVIKKVELADKKTVITYELITLKSTN
jgi:hypothetical protein